MWVRPNTQLDSRFLEMNAGGLVAIARTLESVKKVLSRVGRYTGPEVRQVTSA